MTHISKLTVSDKLLIAAYELDGNISKNFTAEDLVVSAWKHFPRTFGLRGHHDEKGDPLYPDSNRVFAEIMGSKPIRKRGYLVKVGEKTYSLTISGRSRASQLLPSKSYTKNTNQEKIQGKATISRDVLLRLQRLLSSRVVQYVQNNELQRATFHDACLFWGITPSSSYIELEGSFRDLESVVTQIDDAIKGGASSLHTGSNELYGSTPVLLRSVHQELQDMFAKELDTIRQRKDERKS